MGAVTGKGSQAVSVVDPAVPNASLVARALWLPGKTTRHNLLKATRPPAIAWMRTGMRLSVAVLFFLAGYTYLAQIVTVLAVVNLVGAVEGQLSKVALDTWNSGLAYLRGLFAASEDLS